MNSPATPHAGAHHAPFQTEEDARTSLQLITGIAVGLLFAGALVGALLYRSRTQAPKSWYRTVRDEVAEQVALQLKQIKQVATAVASEIDRG